MQGAAPRGVTLCFCVLGHWAEAGWWDECHSTLLWPQQGYRKEGIEGDRWATPAPLAVPALFLTFRVSCSRMVPTRAVPSGATSWDQMMVIWEIGFIGLRNLLSMAEPVSWQFLWFENITFLASFLWTAPLAETALGQRAKSRGQSSSGWTKLGKGAPWISFPPTPLSLRAHAFFFLFGWGCMFSHE